MKSDAPECHQLPASPADAGERLDRFLMARLPGLSRSRLQALIRDGHLTEAEATIREPGHRVKPGLVYGLAVPAAEPDQPSGEAIPLDVVYEDQELIVINKPAGLVVHPAAGHATGTLVNALIAHCGESLSGIGGVRRPGIVHRLDKDTSGLMVVAKNDRAHRSLSEQFAAHGADGRMEREYVAVVWGVPERRIGRIDAPLGRKATARTKMAVVREESGRHAVTRYEVVEVFKGVGGKPVASLVRCILETGRTHQIRVHMAHIGHPVMGDATYAAGFAASRRNLGEEADAALEALGRQALHAAVLGFEHPRTGKKMRFEAEMPGEMGRLVGGLRR